jgi:hypothetical protein
MDHQDVLHLSSMRDAACTRYGVLMKPETHRQNVDSSNDDQTAIRAINYPHLCLPESRCTVSWLRTAVRPTTV